MRIDISIKGYREIVCEDPYREVWNQLHYFTDVASVNSKIRERLGLEKGEHEGNTKKQARQITYSITQAENYFRAAQEVDISVKPNLIYYGISALANTVILYNNDGKFSLDYLRDKKQEQHHGLEKKFDLKEDGSAEEIVEGISCKIYRRPEKPKGQEKPYGHFKNFYNSIVRECIFLERTISFDRSIGKRLSGRPFSPMPYDWLLNMEVMKSADKKRIGDLVETNLDLLTIFKFLPDMVEQLADNEMKSNLFPGSIAHTTHIIEQDQDGKNQVEDQQNYGQTKFYISKLSVEEKEYFKKVSLQDKSTELKKEYPANLYFLNDSRLKSDINYLPDMTQDLFGKVYFIYQVEEYIQELANLYICFFCTGMLCRYYPDYWMRWLEKSVGFKHLMDSLCSVAIRKFPNLILNQLTQCINHFHL